MQAILPSPQVRPTIERHFVLLASDCDHPEPEIRRLGAEHMASARMLPFVLYLDADGKFVHGTSGARDVKSLLHDLEHGRESAEHHH